MARLWAKVHRKHRIIKQATAPCHFDDVQETLVQLCREFDISTPLWLNKHEHEFAEFRRTNFLPEHFMEEVNFDRLEIEYLDDENKKRRSNDPRNYFEGI